jgi:hypothetical protein
VSSIGEVHNEGSALANVKRTSELNEAAYSLLVSPWITALSNPVTAETLKRLHPMRVTRMIFSEQYNPWMKLVHSSAEDIRKDRTPMTADDPAILAERAAFATISDQIKSVRVLRDQATAALYELIFGSSDNPESPTKQRAKTNDTSRMGV